MNEPLTPPDNPEYEYIKIAGIDYVIYHDEYISDIDLNNLDQYILIFEEEKLLVEFGYYWNGVYIVRDLNADEVLVYPNNAIFYEAKEYDPYDRFDI